MKIKLKDGEILVRPNKKKPLSNVLYTPMKEWVYENTGVVKAMGKNVFKIPSEVKVGDEVVFADYSGREFEIGGVMYFLMGYECVLGIVEHAI